MSAQKMFSALFSLVFVLFLQVAFAQDRTVTGKVTDSKDGSPVSGASVTVKGSRTGTSTKNDGTFSLSVPSSATTLVITSIGYEQQEVSIAGQSAVDVSFVASSGSNLNEVVVTGYGSSRKRDLTGSIASVKAKDFNQGINVSPDQLIQGKVAGVQVTNNSGQPGGATTIRIRGNSSLSAGAQPLFVIDGVIIDGTSPRPGLDVQGLGGASGGNPLAFINPNDIASIDILKDASATAIYGSRGSNGVVIVTTKRGSTGAAKVEANVAYGTASMLRDLKVLDGNQYREMLNDYSLTNGNFGGNEDAMGAIFGTASTRAADLALSGGSDNARFRFSTSYLDQEGILQNTNFKKLTAGISSQLKFLKSKKAGVDLNLLVSNQKENLGAVSSNAGFTGNIIATALQWNPTRNLRKADGTINNYFDGSTVNPLEFLEGWSDKMNTTNVVASISPYIKIAKGLEYRLTYGLNYGVAERRNSIRSWVNIEDNGINGTFPNGRGTASIGNGTLATHTVSNTLTYNTKLSNDINFTGLLGFEYFSKDNRGSRLVGKDFAAVPSTLDYTDVMAYGTNGTKRFSSFRSPLEEIQSLFGRFNFDYKGKYLLTATVRRDGSSKFGEDNKYGVFPSFSAAWNLSQEDFMKSVSFFDNLKLRVGWGLTGNQEFPSGAALARYTFNENNGGVSLSQLPNTGLKWQKDGQTNIGIDFSILKRRLSGSIDWFNKTTSQLLLPGVAAQPGPPAVRWSNLDADISNKGFEIVLNGNIINKKDFTWDLGVNLTFIKNNVENLKAPILVGQLFGQGTSQTWVQLIQNGQPLNTFYTRDYQGIDKTTGQSIYTDEGNVFYNVGNPNPEKIVGITTSLTYKKISFSANMNGAYGHQIYNNTLMSVLPIPNLGTRNIAASLFKSGESLTNPITASSRYLESGNYLKLANARLAYNFGALGKDISALSVYITGQNLFVLTDYTGFDPEVNQVNSFNSISSVGIDYIGYPSARTFMFGVNISF
jgi:iron complex outermembrane receptor protein